MIAAASLKVTPTNTRNGRKLTVTGQEKVAQLTTSQAEAGRVASSGPAGRGTAGYIINEDGDRGGKAAPCLAGQRAERRGEESGEQKRSQERTEASTAQVLRLARGARGDQKATRFCEQGSKVSRELLFRSEARPSPAHSKLQVSKVQSHGKTAESYSS